MQKDSRVDCWFFLIKIKYSVCQIPSGPLFPALLKPPLLQPSRVTYGLQHEAFMSHIFVYAASLVSGMFWTLLTWLTSTCPLKFIQVSSLPSSVQYTSPIHLEFIAFVALAHFRDPPGSCLSPNWGRVCDCYPLGPVPSKISQNGYVGWVKDEILLVVLSPAWAWPDDGQRSVSSNYPHLAPTFQSVGKVGLWAHRHTAFDPLTILCLSKEPPIILKSNTYSFKRKLHFTYWRLVSHITHWLGG